MPRYPSNLPFYLILTAFALLPFFISEKEITISQSPALIQEDPRAINRPNPDALRGLYLTNLTATDASPSAEKKRAAILKLIEDGKINALVIDVKEVAGLTLQPELAKFLNKLKEKNVYTIARFVLMADNSERDSHPEWYLRRRRGGVWQDRRGNSWLDPANEAVQDYLIESAKKSAELGFDEIQFDYIRYPSDGNLKKIAYEEKARTPEGRFEIINDFAARLTTALRVNYGADLRLSADIFGYLTVLKEDKIIGQRLLDLAGHFDYLSPMLYPSHFYKGFKIAAVPALGLPELDYQYGAADLDKDVVNRPYQTVYRSLLYAKDILERTSSTARLRPWLQAFDLPFDRKRGITYDASKIYLQIKAADDAGAAGWLLWNASNIYNIGYE